MKTISILFLLSFLAANTSLFSQPIPAEVESITCLTTLEPKTERYLPPTSLCLVQNTIVKVTPLSRSALKYAMKVPKENNI